MVLKLKVSGRIAQPVAEVFEAVADPAKLSQFFATGPGTKGRLETGATVTWDFHDFPGAFPVKIGGEFVNNPAASDNNNGYWAGVTFGKAGKKHTWDLSYRYEYLEANAWYDQITDDDNGAFYQFAPVGAPAGTGTGIYGGTNVKGHLIKGNYSITDSLTLTLTCYITDLISNPATQNGIDVEPNNEAIHAMADITWKF